LASLTETLVDKQSFSYQSIPGLKPSQVEGHSGQFVYGTMDGKPVLFLQGRPHWYEGTANESFHVFIQAIMAFGCTRILMTNAAGAVDPSIPVGGIVSITDHINLQFRNPLIGIQTDSSRFVGMDAPYDPSFRAELAHIASQHNITLHEGVYASTLGPCFETPAEVRALHILGASVVGMSTIPEVITARFYGLSVAVLSIISNKAAGMDAEPLSHALTLSRAQLASGNMQVLVHQLISQSD
jgi:inosine/guanosine/xanthosine phosphorylase family protein